MKQKQKVILIYPMQGLSGTYVKHMPLSLLYASVELVKADYDVQIIDTRAIDGDWRIELANHIDASTVCIGISVMSGSPIKHAVQISRHAKTLDPNIPVVWGGPHATFYPESILRDEWSVDYVISGYASKSFYHLCETIRNKRPPRKVNGACWREGEIININPDAQKSFENIPYKDIPYHLINDYSPYGQLDQDRKIFSMYSALGCPYQCTFCSSPAQYKPVEGKKWVPLGSMDVVDHIQYLVENYDANYIYFIDDDSFPSLKHVEDIIDEIGNRNLSVKLGFRGARINEIKKMSHEFLDKLAAAGTDILHIGAESGSNRILKLMKKNCTYDDIVEMNRKLAKHPTITAAYNFIMGTPTETLEELKQTRNMIMQIVEDHPNCIIFPPNKFRPLPGTELYKVAEKEWGYKMPNTLEMWSNIEVEGDISDQWYEKGMARFCNLMLITSYFIDNKIAHVTEGNTWFYKSIRLANRIYKPIALFRLKHGLSGALVEYWLYRILSKSFSKFQSLDNFGANTS